ncbi:MAG: hypothetical protein V4651_10730 [Bacteroidota bacterium]
MKITMLLACGLLIALFPTLISAQTNSVSVSGIDRTNQFCDTLMVLLPEGNKMLITGQSMRKLLAYSRADSLKQLFVADYEKAIATNTLTAEAPLIHYFVHPSGKRRLKAEVGEYADSKVDVDYEVTRLNLDLPKYRYYIHDLEKDIDMHLYLQNPAQLTSILSNINLSEAIKEAGKEKRSFRKIVKTEIAAGNGQYSITDIKGKVQQYIGINPSLGVTLMGNVLAPVLGLDLTFGSRNKYTVQTYRMGYSFSTFPMVSMAGGDITKVSFVRCHELKYMTNINAGDSRKPSFIGAQIGLFDSEDLSSFNGAYKIGLLHQSGGPYNYSFDYIVDKNNRSLYAFTLKLEF